MSAKFFTSSISKIYYGILAVSKVYKGSSVIYNQQSSFDYVYKILNLTYVTNIEYSIYGLDYDG
ncbi:hypothetical protein EBU95_19985 [bacterium]|nr:hypothetical protein [bacterium]